MPHIPSQNVRVCKDIFFAWPAGAAQALERLGSSPSSVINSCARTASTKQTHMHASMCACACTTGSVIQTTFEQLFIICKHLQRTGMHARTVRLHA